MSKLNQNENKNLLMKGIDVKMEKRFVNEVWVVIDFIEGFEGLYAVSNYGRVKSVKTGKIMIGSVINSGYKSVSFSNQGKMKSLLVHRLVAQAFISNPNNYPCVNHKNEDRLDNNLDNLEWCTVAYNNSHGSRADKFRESMKQTNSSIVVCKTTKEVFDSLEEASKKYNVHASSIGKACRGERPHAGKSETGEPLAWTFVDEAIAEALRTSADTDEATA